MHGQQGLGNKSCDLLDMADENGGPYRAAEMPVRAQCVCGTHKPRVAGDRPGLSRCACASAMHDVASKVPATLLAGYGEGRTALAAPCLRDNAVEQRLVPVRSTLLRMRRPPTGHSHARAATNARAPLASACAQHSLPPAPAGARKLVATLQARGKAVYLISGGFRELCLPVAKALGVPLKHVYANHINWQVRCARQVLGRAAGGHSRPGAGHAACHTVCGTRHTTLRHSEAYGCLMQSRLGLPQMVGWGHAHER